MDGQTARSRRRKAEILLFFLILLFASWSFSAGGWAQASRMDMVFAAVDSHTFRIDEFITDAETGLNTGDWAKVNGHYYSNKAPGQALLAIPFLHLFRLVTPLHAAPDYHWTYAEAWWVNFGASVLPLAIGGIFLFRLLFLMGCSEKRSLFFTITGILGTQLLPYSMTLWGHPLAAVCLILALYFCFPNGKEGSLPLAGFFTGWAVLTEYMAFPAAAALLIFVLHERKIRGGTAFLSGVLLPAMIYLLYHQICFGNPFLPATCYNNPVFKEEQQVLGVFALPSLIRILKLLIGSQRGLLFMTPFLLFAFPGAIRMWKREKAKRPLVLMLLFWILSGILINSSFNGWHGGYSIGPRYLIYAIPAWILFAARAPLETVRSRFLLTLTAGISLFISFATVFTSVLISEEYQNPFSGVIFPFLREGGIPIINSCWIGHFSTTGKINLVTIPGLFLTRSDSRWEMLGLILLLAASLFLFRKAGIDLPGELRHLFRSAADFLAGKREFRPDLTVMVTGIGLLLLFLFPGNVPFINDEPALILRALQADTEDCFVTHGLSGSLNHVYGPLPIWIYQIFLLWTRDPVTVVILKTGLAGLGAAWCLWKAGKKFGRSGTLCTALALASPWFWHYSRGLWDNVFLIPLTALAFWMLGEYLQNGKKRHLLLSAAAVILALWTHSMAFPFAMAYLLLFLTGGMKNLKKDPKTVFLTGITGGAFLLWILLPKLLMSLSAATGTKAAISRISVWKALQFSSECVGTLILPDFRNTSLPFHRFYSPIPLPVLQIVEYGTAAAGAVLLLAGLAGVIRNRKRMEPADQLALFAVFVLILHVLTACCLRIIYLRHYNTMPVIVAGIWLLAYGFDFLRSLRPRIGKTVLAVFLSGCLASVIYAVFLIDFYGGDCSICYGTPLFNQMETAEQIEQRTAFPGMVRRLCFQKNMEEYLPFSIETCTRLLRSSRPLRGYFPQDKRTDCFIHYRYENFSGLLDVHFQTSGQGIGKRGEKHEDHP